MTCVMRSCSVDEESGESDNEGGKETENESNQVDDIRVCVTLITHIV